MNKRLERVHTAQAGLNYILAHLHDVIFEGPDMALFLDDGKVFYVSGYYTKEAYENAKKEKENDQN